MNNNKSWKKSSKFVDLMSGSRSASAFRCEQHPFSSHDVGICPHCLNDRLMILVCSHCGQRRLSSCSCSDIQIHRNSCSTISFSDHTMPRTSFRRSTSSNGFGRIKRLFVNKRNKECRFPNLEFCHHNIQMDHQSHRFSSRMDDDTDTDTGFIDLKLDSCKQEFCGGRSSIASDLADSDTDASAIHSFENGISGNGGGSCRFTIHETETGFKQQGRRMRRNTNNYKFWNWIFKINGEK